MSGSVGEWLPIGAFEDGRVAAAVCDVVDLWSRKWFATDRVEARDFRVQADRRAVGSPAWRVAGEAVALSASAPELARLAGLAMAVDLDRLVLSEADHDIVDRLAGTIVEDLALSFEQAFGAPRETGSGKGAARDRFPAASDLCFSLVAGLPLMDCAVPLALLVPFRKAMAGAGRAEAPLYRLEQAIGATEVLVEARLGEALLSLADLESLVPGDVLILGRSVEEGAAVALASQAVAFARGEIDRQANMLSLVLSTQE